MKFYLRYLSLLLCLVLSLSLFSLTVSAAEINLSPYHVTQMSYVYVGGTAHSFNNGYTFKIGDGVIEKDEYQLDFTGVSSVSRFRVFYGISHDDTSALMDSGIKTTVKLENLHFSFLTLYNGTYTYYRVPTDISFSCGYVDGTVEYFDADIENTGVAKYTVKSTFTPKKDVAQISLYVDMDVNIPFSSPLNVSAYFGEFLGDESYKLTIHQPSEEAGLLSGILGWVQNIFNKVSDGFDNIGSAISNVINSILELPAKLWNLIEEGLKSLFVPSEDDMIAYKDRWQELLADRLGAVYQVTEIIFGAWDEIQVAQETKTIDIPSTTIPLPQGNSFTFGGYSVRIVPEGFEWLATSLKLIIGVLCTFLFINALRHRYDEVMGVEK